MKASVSGNNLSQLSLGCCLSRTEIRAPWGFPALPRPVGCTSHALSEGSRRLKTCLPAPVLGPVPLASCCLSLGEGPMHILGKFSQPACAVLAFGVRLPGTLKGGPMGNNWLVGDNTL